MIATKALRGLDRNALDLPAAALAALAVAFLAYAVPSDLLADLVARTGLPSILPAAQPPLGVTARIGFGAAAAAAAFFLVLALLRLIDRSAGIAAEDEADDAPPRLRRRDFHPDAPPPRPIVAARDLGEPAPPVDPDEPAPAEVPIWLAGIDPGEAPEDPAEPAEQPSAEPWEAPRDPIREIEEAPQDLVADTGPPPAPAGPPRIGSSIPDLMARLERGLAERRARAAAPPEAPAGPAPQVFPEPSDDRLRSAIDSLQRLAARQH